MLRRLVRSFSLSGLYNTLELEPGASVLEIKIAFKRLQKLYDPKTTLLTDKAAAALKLQEIQAAHDQLLPTAPLLPLLLIEKALWSLVGCAFLFLLYRMRPQSRPSDDFLPTLYFMAARGNCQKCGRKVNPGKPHICY